MRERERGKREREGEVEGGREGGRERGSESKEREREGREATGRLVSYTSPTPTCQSL